MKRAFCAAVFVLALTLASGGDVVAHRITVTTPAGEVVDKDLARNITPRLFDEDSNNVGKDEGTFSADSRGTNAACEAIPEDGTVLITGGTCHK